MGNGTKREVGQATNAFLHGVVAAAGPIELYELTALARRGAHILKGRNLGTEPRPSGVAIRRLLECGGLVLRGTAVEGSLQTHLVARTLEAEEAQLVARCLALHAVDRARADATGSARLALAAAAMRVRWVRVAYDGLEQVEPALAVRAALSVVDAMYYLKLLRFDDPFFVDLVAAADRAKDLLLRAASRIALARARIEVAPAPGAEALCREALACLADARATGVTEELWLEGDALRGLGWARLAQGSVADAEAAFLEAEHRHESIAHARGLADAAMARGVLAIVQGDPAGGRRRFFRAEAILRSRDDRARLDKLAALRVMLSTGSPVVAAASVAPSAPHIDAEDLIDRGQFWRAALALHRGGERERAAVLAELAGVAWAEAHVRAPLSGSWRLLSEGSSIMLEDPIGARVDLTRKGLMVRLIVSLANGSPRTTRELFASGWLEERASDDAALMRVHTAVRRLRTLKLPIQTTSDGYRFIGQLAVAPNVAPRARR